jgi:DHA1 family inner membrane transport protein
MASTPRTPPALYALAVGAFGIGTTEFLPMGLLPQIATGLGVGIAVAGLLISGYALGVFIGAPLITLSTRRWSRKTVLIALMAAFTLGNLLSALATDFAMLMAARVVTSLAHGTFFGVGSVVATSLVGRDRHASAIATMFNGLALATLLGVPAGAWLGLHLGWHAPFWAVSIIGVAAIAALGWLLPDLRKDTLPVPLKTELRILAGGPVLLALATTVFGFAGVFVIYTYIAPILTKVTGFADSAVSPILLMFGVGMLIGNPLGGRLADRRLVPALLGTLAVLAVVLGGFALVLDNRVLMLLFTGLLGAGMFATVAPLQLWVMQKAVAAPSLASSLNIGAFNLANALGAWLGSETIAHGFGLNALPWIAALVTAVGIALALFAVRSDIGARSAQPRPVRRPEFPLFVEVSPHSCIRKTHEHENSSLDWPAHDFIDGGGCTAVARSAGTGPGSPATHMDHYVDGQPGGTLEWRFSLANRSAVSPVGPDGASGRAGQCRRLTRAYPVVKRLWHAPSQNQCGRYCIRGERCVDRTRQQPCGDVRRQDVGGDSARRADAQRPD